MLLEKYIITKIEEFDRNNYTLGFQNILDFYEEFENVEWELIEKCFFKNGNLKKCFIIKYDIDEDGGFTWVVRLPKELKEDLEIWR